MEEINLLIATCMECGERYEKEKLGEDGHECEKRLEEIEE